MLGVVKACGYGSGSIEVSKLLESLGIDYFAVAYINEGIELRKAGIESPILVLHPQISNFKKAIEFNLEPSLYSKRVLRLSLIYLFSRVLKITLCTLNLTLV